MLSLHPYLNYLYCFAYTRMCKDLKLVDDWTLQRCIHRWFEKDPMSDHKKNVAYLLSKIPFSFINVKANQSSPSLMVRVLNAVDSCWFASNKGLDHAAINEILNDFKAEQIFDVQGNTRSVNPNSNNFNTNNNNNAPMLDRGFAAHSKHAIYTIKTTPVDMINVGFCTNVQLTLKLGKEPIIQPRNARCRKRNTNKICGFGLAFYRQG